MAVDPRSLSRVRSDLPSDLLEDPDNVRLGEGGDDSPEEVVTSRKMDRWTGQEDDRGLDNMGLAEQCDDSQGLHYKL